MIKKPNYVFDDELYHHGIQGQKWGERRFQNEDGSWTPEGRERYGKGEDFRAKAKNTYNTQKYKADLNSKAKQDKATRSAKEERHSIKENAKTMRLARKEQGKFDRLNKKENAKLDNQGLKKFRNTKNMSDDELQRAIDRLKLQAEYNKQYALASSPNSALVKADRFFEGPTGKFVADLAVRTLPEIAKTVVSKSLEKDKGLSDLEIREKEATIAKNIAEAHSKNAAAEKIRTDLLRDKYDYTWTKDSNLGNILAKNKKRLNKK
jgi:hypothetical protein